MDTNYINYILMKYTNEQREFDFLAYLLRKPDFFYRNQELIRLDLFTNNNAQLVINAIGHSSSKNYNFFSAVQDGFITEELSNYYLNLPQSWFDENKAVQLLDILSKLSNIRQFLSLSLNSINKQQLTENIIDNINEQYNALRLLLDKTSEKRAQMHIVEVDEYKKRLCDFLLTVKNKSDEMVMPLFFNADLDNQLRTRRGNLVVIAARTGVGKTLLATDIFLKSQKRYSSIYFSMEMNEDEIVERHVQYYLNNKLIDSELTHKEYEKIAELKHNNTLIVHKNRLTVDDIEYIIQQKIKDGIKIDYVFVDYLTHMNISSKNTQYRQDVKDAVIKLKNIADDYQVVLVLLSQVTRASQNNRFNDMRPALEDLSESKSIEDEANQVILIHDHSQFDSRINNVKRLLEINVAKNRRGDKMNFLVEVDIGGKFRLCDIEKTNNYLRQVNTAPKNFSVFIEDFDSQM